MRSLWIAVVVAALACGARWLARPGRGDPVAPPCAIPIEASDGRLRCLSYAEARACGLSAGDREGGGRMNVARIEALEVVVDLNQASPAELATISGIGDKLAQRIVAGRPYRDLDELLRVRGVGAKRLAAWRGRLRVTSPNAHSP